MKRYILISALVCLCLSTPGQSRAQPEPEPEGSVYVIATHLENWADPEGFGIDGSVDYPDNMYTLSVGSWLVGDALGYGGDYMMAVQVMSYGGGIRTLSSFDNAPDMDYNGGEINSSLMASTSDLAPMHFSSEP